MKRVLVGAAAGIVLAMLILPSACARPQLASWKDIDPGKSPIEDSVDAVLIFVGDAGEEIAGESPLLERMKQEIEVWSEKLGRDSAVTVLFLGDNVYPQGVHDRTDPMFVQDSVILWSQINLLSGPKARTRGTIGWFLPGNHDWGNMTGANGLRRLKNQEEQILAARKARIPVQLAPAAGLPGPVVRDIRNNMRLLMIDTHLYLQQRSLAARQLFIAGIEKAIVDAGDRHIIIAAHHPYTTAGPHGELIAPLSRAMGLVFLLEKSGTLVQDLNSPIYKDLLYQLNSVFVRTRPPLAFLGGHDHSLQVHRRKTSADPLYTLVSGGGSKGNPLVGADSMRYGTSRPGFMTLVFSKRGAVDLFVTAGTTKAAEGCEPAEADGGVPCVKKESVSFSVVYSERLAEYPPPAADTQATSLSLPRKRQPK